MEAIELLRPIVRAALLGDIEAAAWLRGEGYIQTVRGLSRFQRFDEERTSPAATAWRIAVFTRDGYRCQECGATGQLNAHHLRPWAMAPALRFDVNNGITLCIEHHAQRHPDHANLIRKAHYHRG